MKEVHVIITNDSSCACADLELTNWVNGVLESPEDTVMIATQMQIYALRLAHKNQELKVLDILTENNELLYVDEKSLLSGYPKGMVSLFDDYLDALIDWNL